MTEFFRLKVVLLGAFNGQGLATVSQVGIERLATVSMIPQQDGEEDTDCPVRVLLRVTPGNEYVKVVLYQGRVIGALLVGEAATELAETFENLILNRINIEALNLDILNPDFDLEDYFD